MESKARLPIVFRAASRILGNCFAPATVEYQYCLKHSLDNTTCCLNQRNCNSRCPSYQDATRGGDLCDISKRLCCHFEFFLLVRSPLGSALTCALSCHVTVPVRQQGIDKNLDCFGDLQKAIRSAFTAFPTTFEISIAAIVFTCAMVDTARTVRSLSRLLFGEERFL